MHCDKCVMPIWDGKLQFGRPGLGLSENGTTCVACKRAEDAKAIDWDARHNELEHLCDRHRKGNGDPDVIVPVSGGKDSHFQVKALRDLGMTPFLVCVCDCFGVSEAGKHNLANLERYAAGLITWRQNPDRMKEQMRFAFEHWGKPTHPVDLAIYAVPPRIAAQMNVPLIVYGEDISWTYGGSGAKDSPDASAQLDNDVVASVDAGEDKESRCAFRPVQAPDFVEPIYLSYFLKWSGRVNADVAMGMGFKASDDPSFGDKGWDRAGFCENYDQIDSLGYVVHPWLKWVKFGAGRVSDVCSNLIRGGYMTRQEAVDKVREWEGPSDTEAREDFCAVLGYTTEEFWEIVGRHTNALIHVPSSRMHYGTLKPELQLR